MLQQDTSKQRTGEVEVLQNAKFLLANARFFVDSGVSARTMAPNHAGRAAPPQSQILQLTRVD
jgi:hypothetical protein